MTEPIDPKRLESPPWQQGTRLVAGVLIILMGMVVLYLLRGLAAMFLIGLLIAYILHPFASWLERRARFPRWAAALLVLIAFLAVVACLATGVGLALSQRIIALAAFLGDIATQLPEQIRELLGVEFMIGPWRIDFGGEQFSQLLSDLASSLSPVLSQAGSFLGSLALAAANVVGRFVIVLIISFYLLLDFRRLRPALFDLIPDPYKADYDYLVREGDRIWRAFLRGQLLLGLIVGAVVGLTMTVVGLEFPLVMGVIAGLMEMVPMFGPVISTVIGGLVALAQSGNIWGMSPLGFALLVCGIFVMIQQIENAYLVPRVMGESLNLHPLAVFLGLLAGGTLGGVIGMLLAAPVVASLRLMLGYLYYKVVDVQPQAAPVMEARAPRRRMDALAKRLRAWRESLLVRGRAPERDEDSK